jgi:hypothetical protein
VASVFDNFYSQWRTRTVSAAALQDNAGSPPPEFLLQAIWQQQRLVRDQLFTLDGQTVRVLHPGFKNREAGPDFRGAMVQIGTSAARRGDVEIDLRANGWHAHGHDRNPAFKDVVLHVIWEGDRGLADHLPVMTLSGRLDAPLSELNDWFGRDVGGSLPENLRGKCCAPLTQLPPESLTKLLHEAAQVRWRGKAQQLEARARQAGWEQALWEGLFRALGYKQNVWPMQRLAELRTAWFALGDAIACQARLFGISGLLPADLVRKPATADKYLRRIWDQWWREREHFREIILPRQLWKFNSLRPANHPQRRLALAAHWIAAGDLPAKLEAWFMSEIAENELAESLLKILQIELDDFWSWHWTFASARLAKAQPMIGAARVTDLAMNVILPWFWMRAVEGRNEKLRREAERRYLAWPAAEDNSALRLARERLLGGTKASALGGAAAQQGLLQIQRDFCDHSNALCDDCQFPELVKDFVVTRAANAEK